MLSGCVRLWFKVNVEWSCNTIVYHSMLFIDSRCLTTLFTGTGQSMFLFPPFMVKFGTMGSQIIETISATSVLSLLECHVLDN